MAEFLADALAYAAPGFFQGFQAANQYRRQKTMDEFQMKMREEEFAIRKMAEERLAQQARQQAELHSAQMENYRAQAEQRRVGDLMKPIDPQDPLINDLSMNARARALAAVKGMPGASHEAPPLAPGQFGPPDISPYDQLQAQYQGAAGEIQGIAEKEVERRNKIAQLAADAKWASATKPPMARPRDMRPTPKQGADVANLDLAAKMLDDIESKVKASPNSTGIAAGIRTSKIARLTGVGLDKKALDTKTYVEQQLNTMILRLAGTTFSDRYLERLKDQMVNIWESGAAFDTKLQAMKGIVGEWRDSMVRGVEYSGRDSSLMRSDAPSSPMSIGEALSEFSGFEVQ